MRKLLEDMVNGNKVVRRLLDSAVSETGDNENAVDYRIRIDFSSISDENCNQQTHNCVFDLLKFKSNRSGPQAGAFQGEGRIQNSKCIYFLFEEKFSFQFPRMQIMTKNTNSLF